MFLFSSPITDIVRAAFFFFLSFMDIILLEYRWYYRRYPPAHRQFPSRETTHDSSRFGAGRALLARNGHTMMTTISEPPSIALFFLRGAARRDEERQRHLSPLFPCTNLPYMETG